MHPNFILPILLLVSLCIPTIASDSVEPMQYELFYLYDKQGLVEPNDLLTAEFSKVKATPFNNGIINGTYWFKVSINDTSHSDRKVIFEIKEPYIKQSLLYEKDKNSLTFLFASGNDIELSKHPVRNRNIIFPVSLRSGENIYYIKADFHRNTSFIFYIHDESVFYNKEKYNYGKMGFYYGFTLMIILINLLFYFTLKDKLYLFYGLTVLCITTILLHLDGWLIYVFHPGWLLDNVDILSYIAVCYFGGHLFARQFLNLDMHLPKSKAFDFIFLGLTIALFILFLILNSVLIYALAICSMWLYISHYWVYSIVFIKKQAYAKFMAFAYAIMVIISILYAVPIIFGFDILKSESEILKIGCGIEMLTFLYAIVYRSKILRAENKKMLSEIQEFSQKLDSTKNSFLSYQQYMEINFNPTEITNLKNGFDLTDREIEVLQEISKRKTNPQIADSLFVSVNTIKFHTRNIYQKLDVSGREEIYSKDIIDSMKN